MYEKKTLVTLHHTQYVPCSSLHISAAAASSHQVLEVNKDGSVVPQEGYCSLLDVGQPSGSTQICWFDDAFV